jgi:hypothetical protein
MTEKIHRIVGKNVLEDNDILNFPNILLQSRQVVNLKKNLS